MILDIFKLIETQGSCPEGWTKSIAATSPKCWRIYSTNGKLSWYVAFRRCFTEDIDSFIATPGNQAEVDEIMSLVTAGKYMYYHCRKWLSITGLFPPIYDAWHHKGWNVIRKNRMIIHPYTPHSTV